jgi:hypothetical protein
VAACALLLALPTLAACSGADPDAGDLAAPGGVDASDAAGAPQPVPTIPEVAGAPSDAPMPAPPTDPPAPRPRPGQHVLAALEGPLTDREATDVVLRTERGVELDRFRLAGARDLVAAPGGRWALVPTGGGGWALLDGRDARLTLLTFVGDPPVGTPRIRGALAWWDDPEAPWLLRLDDGVARPMREVHDQPGVAVVGVSADGSRVLLRGSTTVVADTATGEVRDTVQTDRIAMGPDGSVAAVTSRDGQVLLVVQQPGADPRELAILADLGTPVPLADGRVAVLGATSAVADLSGAVTALPPVAGITGAPLASTDGRIVLVPTGQGLVVVDVTAGTVEPVTGTAGFTPVDHPTAGWLWALGEDGSGAVVVEVATGTATRLQEGIPAGPVSSITADGGVLAIGGDGDGRQAVVVRADGTAGPAVADADMAEVALHPGGSGAATAVVRDGVGTLLVGDVQAPSTTIDTGRSPVWLRTDAA